MSDYDLAVIGETISPTRSKTAAARRIKPRPGSAQADGFSGLRRSLSIILSTSTDGPGVAGAASE